MKKINRQLVIDCLQELSDRHLQMELWLSSGGDNVSSFAEVVEQLYTDSGLGDALPTKSSGFGIEVETALSQLRAKLKKLDWQRPPLNLIEDIAMDSIRANASHILQLIDSDIQSRSTNTKL